MPVKQNAGSTLLTGDAVGGFRCAVVKSAISLYLKTGMQANRAYTPANMRAVATEYTKVVYPRSRKGLERALADLEALMQGRTLDEVGALERTDV
jgi:hypothetical protein